MSENTDQEFVKSCYQGLFITQTVLGNPNGSFIGNEPRNINGQVFTTDKCIKYNVRNYIHQNFEKIEKNDKNKITDRKDFVFFYPRRSDETIDKKMQTADYITKDAVFNKYFKEPAGDEDPVNSMLDNCIDVRMFGGTFSFESEKLEGMGGQIYGPIQLSYGLDLIGADIIHLKMGTPFSTTQRGKDPIDSESGKQTTTAEEYGVDHAVIGYDITVNPNNQIDLLRVKDLAIFKEALVYGTNLRRSTSKKTESMVLIMCKFIEGKSISLGEMKHLIEIESRKITDPVEKPDKLVLDMTKINDKLVKYKDHIEKIEVYIDEDAVELKNFPSKDEIDSEIKPFSTLLDKK
jgi:CRISPR-associated protein Csh2